MLRVVRVTAMNRGGIGQGVLFGCKRGRNDAGELQGDVRGLFRDGERRRLVGSGGLALVRHGTAVAATPHMLHQMVRSFGLHCHFTLHAAM